jgi:hypothetical protein
MPVLLILPPVGLIIPPQILATWLSGPHVRIPIFNNSEFIAILLTNFYFSLKKKKKSLIKRKRKV